MDNRKARRQRASKIPRAPTMEEYKDANRGTNVLTPARKRKLKDIIKSIDTAAEGTYLLYIVALEELVTFHKANRSVRMPLFRRLKIRNFKEEYAASKLPTNEQSTFNSIYLSTRA